MKIIEKSTQNASRCWSFYKEIRFFQNGSNLALNFPQKITDDFFILFLIHGMVLSNYKKKITYARTFFFTFFQAHSEFGLTLEYHRIVGCVSRKKEAIEIHI